jgi:hypothetical protein
MMQMVELESQSNSPKNILNFLEFRYLEFFWRDFGEFWLSCKGYVRNYISLSLNKGRQTGCVFNQYKIARLFTK